MAKETKAAEQPVQKVDENFYRECRKAHTELKKSGELQRLMSQRLWPMKDIPQKPREKD